MKFNKIFTETKEQYDRDMQVAKETGFKSELLIRLEKMNKDK